MFVASGTHFRRHSAVWNISKNHSFIIIILNLKISFSSIVKKALNLYKHPRIRSWNHPVLSNKCKVSCSRKQRLSLTGFELMRLETLRLLVRRVHHSTTPTIRNGNITSKERLFIKAYPVSYTMSGIFIFYYIIVRITERPLLFNCRRLT